MDEVDELVWLPTPAGPVAGWVSTPAGGRSRAACVVLPAVGYPYWSAHRSVRALAHRLADLGVTTLRLDYHGTGDSSGTGWEPGRLEAWRDSVLAAYDHLSDGGRATVGVCGLQLGGSLALELLVPRRPAFVVAWDPVASGRRFDRELRLIAIEEPDGGLSYAGSPFPPELLEALAHVPSAPPDQPLDTPVLLVSGRGRVPRAMSTLARGYSSHVDQLAFDTQVLEVSAEEAEPPEELLEAVAGWVDRTAPTDWVEHADPAVPDVPHPAEVVRFGAAGLVGLVTDPPAGPSRTVVVFLNSGSEVHTGPGRAWVAYARAVNEAGFSTVLLDFSGWGESPDHGEQPGRPYDAHCLDETLQLVGLLAGAGRRVVLTGLCAGAWVALRAALLAPVDGVFAINPQMYWRPGDPVEALISTTIERRAPDRVRERRGARWRWWSTLDTLHVRPPAAEWLDRLASSGCVVRLEFGENDEGLGYLRTRVGRRLRAVQRSSRVSVAEVPGADHGMHRTWRRGPFAADLVAVAHEVESG